jgi:hypothetical protein
VDGSGDGGGVLYCLAGLASVLQQYRSPRVVRYDVVAAVAECWQQPHIAVWCESDGMDLSS